MPETLRGVIASTDERHCFSSIEFRQDHYLQLEYQKLKNGSLFIFISQFQSCTSGWDAFRECIAKRYMQLELGREREDQQFKMREGRRSNLDSSYFIANPHEPLLLCPNIKVEGRTFDVTECYLETEIIPLVRHARCFGVSFISILNFFFYRSSFLLY